MGVFGAPSAGQRYTVSESPSLPADRRTRDSLLSISESFPPSTMRVFRFPSSPDRLPVNPRLISMTAMGALWLLTTPALTVAVLPSIFSTIPNALGESEVDH